MQINPNQFSRIGQPYEEYADDTTSSWRLRGGGTAGNVRQGLVIEQTGNGRWGARVSQAQYDTDSSGNIESMRDSDADVDTREVRTPRGRKDFRTPTRALVVGRNMAPSYAREFAEREPEY